MSGLSSAADAVHLKNICLKFAPKVRQLEKRLHPSNSAARGFKFHKMVLRGSRKDAELSKPS